MTIEEEIASILHAGIVKAAREDRIIIEVFDETPGFDFELDLAKSLSPLLNRVRAEAAAKAIRDASEKANLHRLVPDGRDDLAHLCEDDDCLWWDMTYALRDELNERATEIEQNSEVPSV